MSSLKSHSLPLAESYILALHISEKVVGSQGYPHGGLFQDMGDEMPPGAGPVTSENSQELTHLCMGTHPGCVWVSEGLEPWAGSGYHQREETLTGIVLLMSES